MTPIIYRPLREATSPTWPLRHSQKPEHSLLELVTSQLQMGGTSLILPQQTSPQPLPSLRDPDRANQKPSPYQMRLLPSL
ncbi:hypothetical protein DPMN_147865 [Dreissena polymorpha]|uniref:Uncharacterized protein n=1 Tax=Dreissena polymorpha TaxID=45954 RepID=A0A9D4F8I1_DREPO|nr:hypothetical protein DPMN_147865 [Dreissena polymorpha]